MTLLARVEAAIGTEAYLPKMVIPLISRYDLGQANAYPGYVRAVHRHNRRLAGCD